MREFLMCWKIVAGIFSYQLPLRIGLSFSLAMRRTVEAVRAYLAFRQTDGFDKVLERVEAQGIKAELFPYHLNHAGIAFSRCVSVFIKMFVALLSFEFQDHTTGNQFHLIF